MYDEDAANFKIRLDDDDDILADDEQKHVLGKNGYKGGDSQVVKSNRRILFVAIFLPCLVGIGLFVAYIDIKERIAADISNRAIVVTKLSRELETRLSAIAANYESLEKKTDAAVSEISGKLTKIKKSVNALKSSKTDTKAFKSAINGLQDRFAPLEKDINAVKSDISALSRSFEKSMADINEAIAANTALMTAATNELSEIKSKKMDKSLFEASFQAENERYTKLVGDLNQELGSLKYKIKTLENRLLKTASGTEPAVEPTNPVDPNKNIIIEQTIH